MFPAAASLFFRFSLSPHYKVTIAALNYYYIATQGISHSASIIQTSNAVELLRKGDNIYTGKEGLCKCIQAFMLKYNCKVHMALHSAHCTRCWIIVQTHKQMYMQQNMS